LTPLTKAELAEVHRYRVGKPATRALPKDSFRDPIYSVRMVTERIAREREKMWKRESVTTSGNRP
jgi:hypothetical protein